MVLHDKSKNVFDFNRPSERSDQVITLGVCIMYFNSFLQNTIFTYSRSILPVVLLHIIFDMSDMSD